ncbi:hypothetical protein AAVH_20281 [Aphelenchoides avenae]|nr:hypothetical protein AAVH_20281 [Aphelenchus avenae]
MDSSDDEEETIRWAYQDAKAALLSEEPNFVACFQRVLTMEGKKGSKTVWGFKALKHLVIATIQANDLDAAAAVKYGRLLEYSGVVSSAIMEPAIDEIIVLAQDPKAALMICLATYNVKKPTMTWMARCIALLSHVQHTQDPELLAAALESASTLRNMISDAAYLDDTTRQSHLLSIDAITAEFRFRRQEFVDVYVVYQQLKGKPPSNNPGAVAAIHEIFAKVLLSPSSKPILTHCTILPGRTRTDPHLVTAECLEKALELHPSTDTQAHIRCWRYLAVNKALNGTTASSKLAMPDVFKPDVDVVVRLVALYIEDHGDQFLAAWEQARDELADAFLQEFFDPITMERYAVVRDARLLMICAAQIETFSAEGMQYREEASFGCGKVGAYEMAQKIDSQAAAIVCQLYGENEIRRGHLSYAREQLSRAFTLHAGGNQDRRRECAVLLAFANYFQVCRVKYRIEDDAVAFLGPEECEKLKELADALRKGDSQGYAHLLQNSNLRLSDFMHDVLATLSDELTTAMTTMDQALELRASGKWDELGTLIMDLNAKCSRGLWFDALRIQISAFVATASLEVRRQLRQIAVEGRELENCEEAEVLALSLVHDSWGRECLSRQKFDAAGRHFEKALRAYESNVSATGFLGARFLALSSLANAETLFFDEAIVRFDQWFTEETKAALRRFYDAHAAEDMAAVERVVTRMKESKDKQLGTNTHLTWNLIFDRLSHRDLHDFQLACRRFRSIVRPRLHHAPIGPIAVSAQLAPSRHVWAVQCYVLRPQWREPDRSPVSTIELVERLDEFCGSSPIPKLVIRGDAAPLDHPRLLECAARHEVTDLVLETDFSGLAYAPLRRFLQSWKRIDGLTIITPNAADSVCVSDDLLCDAAACGIEKVSVRCERAAGITDEGILDFWLSATPRSLEVIRPAISHDFLRRLLEASCAPSEAHSEPQLTVYASPKDVLRQLHWDEYLDHRKGVDASGTVYEFATSGVALEVKVSLNEYCPLEGAPTRDYDVLRVYRRRVEG